MDYERKYNSALERAKYALTTDMDNSGHWACTYIFPELKEMSEKEIIQYLVEECESIVPNSDFTNQERTTKAEKAIGWLKKRLSDEGVRQEENRQKDYKNIPGSIIYADSNGKLKATSKEEWNPSFGTPVAVVVIPASHMSDGKCRGMSLCNMSYVTPQTGTLGIGNGNAETNGTNLMWGVHGTHVSGLTNYDTVKTTGGTTDYGYFPSDLYKGMTKITIVDGCTTEKKLIEYDMTTQDSADDTEAVWWRTIDNIGIGGVGDELLVISPYASDGSQNPAYLTKGQALSDMGGKANTEVLVNLSAIKDTYSGGAFENIEANYPAAFACYLFSTVGTDQGDWYLPALGELGYLYTRIKRINESLASLGTSAIQFGDLTNDGSSLGYWCRSSSECDKLHAWGFSDGGRMDGNSKGNNHENTRVRAFAAFDI